MDLELDYSKLNEQDALDIALVIEDEAELAYPADLPAELADELRAMAIAAYRAIEASGMARVDFLLEEDGGEPPLPGEGGGGAGGLVYTNANVVQSGTYVVTVGGGGAGFSSVDLNTIPASIVERIEVPDRGHTVFFKHLGMKTHDIA